MDTIKIGIQFDPSGLQGGAKQSVRALSGLGKGALSAGQDLDRFARKGDAAEESLDDLRGAAERSEQSLGRLDSRLTRSANGATRYGSAIRGAGKAIQYGSEKLVNQYTAIAGGAGFGLAAKQAMDFDSKLRRVAINARDAQGQIQGKGYVSWFKDVRKELLALSEQTGVAPDGLLSGLERIQQLSGDVALARRQMGLAAQVAIVSDADVAEVVNLMDVLNKKGNVTQDNMRKTMEMIVAMGRNGAFDISQFASEGARMMTVLPMFGQGGKVDAKSLESFTAMANVAMSASGGSKEMARTSVVALANDLSNVATMRSRARQAGVSSASLADALYTDRSHTTMRSIEEMVRRIIVMTNGKTETLSALFGEGSQGMVNDIANNWRSNGRSFAFLDQMHQTARDAATGTDLGRDFRDMMGANEELKKSLSQVRTVAWDLAQFLLDNLTPALRWANQHSDAFKAAVIGLGAAFTSAAAIVAAGKIKQFITGAIGAFGGGGKGLAAGAASAAFGGATPVYVVNMGGMGMNPAGSIASEAAAAEQAVAQGASKAGIMSRMFSRFGGWISSSSAWIGNAARNAGVWGQGRIYAGQRLLGRSAVGRWAMSAGEGLMERGSSLWRNTMWGSTIGANIMRWGSRLSPLARGIGGAAMLGLPIEYLLNGFSMRSTVAGVGSAVGGTLGALGGGAVGAAGTFGVGAAPLAFAGGAAGGWAGREGALAAYDWIAELLAKKDEQSREATAPQQINMNISFDASGRPTARVEGPGASGVRLNTPRIGPNWAPGLAG